jgi:hypothetical protein
MLLCLFLFCASAEAASPRAAKHEGCWVRFFGDEDFKRPIARVVGALFLNSVFGPGYIDAVSVRDFPRRVRSLAVGPEARVFVYAEPGFKSEVANLGPDDKVPDLASIGFPKAVGSLKILCAR